MQNNLAALLHRTAVLMNEDDGERWHTLGELVDVLRNPQTNKTGSRAVLDNEEVMDVLLNLSATTGSASVSRKAFVVLLQVARDLDNARRLFREHPSLILVVMHKLEFGTNDQVQVTALCVLHNLACNDDNARSMTTKTPALVPLLMAKVESYLEQFQTQAFNVLQGLAAKANNAHDMVTKNPTLVPLLMAKVGSISEQVQIKALETLSNLAVNDNVREIVTKNPAFVSLLMVKVESHSEQAQVGALGVLHNLTVNVDNAREMVTQYPTLVSLLVTKAESDSDQVEALGVLQLLALHNDNAREMVTQHPALVSLLVAKAESNSEQVQVRALKVLNNLAVNADNSWEMVTTTATLLPLLATKMSESTASLATRVVYGLSSCPANRAILCGSDSVVAALTKGREGKDASLFPLLALVNLFGAEEDSEVLKTDLAMMQRIFSLIARAMNNDAWSLNAPLLAFRYLCVVEHNRQLLWGEYGSKFPIGMLAALQDAIKYKNTSAAESAVSILAQFSNDPEPLVWMRGNRSLLDKVFDQLAPFPEALRTAQSLLLVVKGC